METRAVKSSPPRSFTALEEMFPLRPIGSESELDRAAKIVDRLAILDRRTTDQEDYLETLSLLIEAYEDRHHTIDVDDLDPIAILRSLMDSHGMSASDLGRLLGNRSLGAAILRRDRALSKANIMKLCAHFAVGPQLFLEPPRRVDRKSTRLNSSH